MNKISNSQSWIVHTVKPKIPRIRLFCFPFLGGNSSYFNDWSEHLPSWIDVCAIELPGRQKRLFEEPITKFQTLIDNLGYALRPFISEIPFVFFGHSFGGLVSFELANKIKKDAGVAPQALFISGCAPPSRLINIEWSQMQGEKQIIDWLRKLQGTPEWALENAEFIDFVLPVIKADYELLKTYHYVETQPINIPIYTFGGINDYEVSEGDLREWSKFTNRNFEMHLFPGGHFFINTTKKEFLSKIYKLLRPLI